MYIWKIIGLLFAIVFIQNLNAQKKEPIIEPKYDEWLRGLRIGYDISRFALYQFQPERKAYEISFDSEWRRNYFAVVEMGKEDCYIKNINEGTPTFEYNSSGYYTRIGFDKNILKRDVPKSADLVHIGLRYGFYAISQTTHWYEINEQYWGSISNHSPSSQTLTGHWTEIVLGAKVEMFKNIFVGTSARARFLLYSQKNINYPYAKPGFGDGNAKVVLGINYYVSYQIPIMKMKTVIDNPLDKKNNKTARKIK